VWYKYCVLQQSYDGLAKQINNPYAPNLGVEENTQDGVVGLDDQYSQTSSPLEKAQEDSSPDVHGMTIEELLEFGRTDPKESGKIGYNKYLDKKNPETGANTSIFDQNESSPPTMWGKGGSKPRYDEGTLGFTPTYWPASKQRSL
jgi:hypothetical protein